MAGDHDGGDAEASTLAAPDPVATRGAQTGELSPDLRAPGRCRAFVRDMLELWHADDLEEVAELLTAELVANAVRHAMTDFDLELQWEPPVLRIQVRDGSPKPPTLVEMPGEHGGFGLRIIAELADAVGVDELPDGKVVWCELRSELRERE